MTREQLIEALGECPAGCEVRMAMYAGDASFATAAVLGVMVGAPGGGDALVILLRIPTPDLDETQAEPPQAVN